MQKQHVDFGALRKFAYNMRAAENDCSAHTNSIAHMLGVQDASIHMADTAQMAEGKDAAMLRGRPAQKYPAAPPITSAT